MPIAAETNSTKIIGIVAHSAEGGALCFITACREGSKLMGEHMHPEIVLSAVPMALSMPGYLNDDHDVVAEQLAKGVQQVADAGADFYICPDNTAHIILEKIADRLPLPGLHIAQIVCRKIARNGWKRVGLLGTKYTMTGPVYENALNSLGLERLTPNEAAREKLDDAIFDELCNGVFEESTTQLFVDAISDLQSRGAECVILGCTEIPLIITPENSPLPILDSTRLLAEYAVRAALDRTPIQISTGWLEPSD